MQKDSPGRVELNQPETVTLHHLTVEVRGAELHYIITCCVEPMDSEDESRKQHTWMETEAKNMYRELQQLLWDDYEN